MLRVICKIFASGPTTSVHLLSCVFILLLDLPLGKALLTLPMHLRYFQLEKPAFVFALLTVYQPQESSSDQRNAAMVPVLSNSLAGSKRVPYRERRISNSLVCAFVSASKGNAGF